MMIQKIDHQVQHETVWHSHQDGQLYWLSKGIILVETSDSQWPMTPGTLGWIPANSRHKAHTLADVDGWIVRVAQDIGSHYPNNPRVFGVDSFCHALLKKIVYHPRVSYPKHLLEYLLEIIGYELDVSRNIKFELPLPYDRRARKMAEFLIGQPSNISTQAQLANCFGLSTRTLSRVFTKETGLTFTQWRQQARLINSMQWLLDDEPIYDVAVKSGYGNVSAYISAFKRNFNETPGQFKRNSLGKNQVIRH